MHPRLKRKRGVAEMAVWLKALADLAEDLDLIPSTSLAHNRTPSSGLWDYKAHIYICICVYILIKPHNGHPLMLMLSSEFSNY